MLPFIRELTEARMFFNANDMKGKSAEEIAGTVYLLIMALQILRYDAPNTAKSYAGDTMRYQPYDKMHYSATDLGNLIAVLNNQDDFSDKIKANPKVNIPLFAINRYLSDTRSGSISHNDDATFFYRLEDYLRLYSNSVFRKLRRDVGDWRNLNFTDRVQIVTLLRREFDKRATNVDLYLWFKQNYRVKEDTFHTGNTLMERASVPAHLSAVKYDLTQLKKVLWEQDLPLAEVVEILSAVLHKYMISLSESYDDAESAYSAVGLNGGEMRSDGHIVVFYTRFLEEFMNGGGREYYEDFVTLCTALIGHEMNHREQAMKHAPNATDGADVVNMAEYLSDHREIESYAVQASVELLAQFDKDEILQKMSSNIENLALYSNGLMHYLHTFDTSSPVMKEFVKKLYALVIDSNLTEAITSPIRDNDISFKSTLFSYDTPVIDSMHGLQLKKILQDDDLYYGLFDPAAPVKNTLVGLLQLERFNDSLWQVRLAQISENYKSQGFGTYLYDYAVMNDGMSILSDTNLSEGGPGGSKGLWEKLYRHGRYTVCGYNLDTNTPIPGMRPEEVFNQREDLVCLATPKALKESISEMLSRVNTKHRIVEWYGPTVKNAGQF